MDGAIVTEGSVQIFSDMKWFRNLASTAIVNIAVGELCVKKMFWPMRWQGPLGKPSFPLTSLPSRFCSVSYYELVSHNARTWIVFLLSICSISCLSTISEYSLTILHRLLERLGNSSARLRKALQTSSKI